MGFSRSLAFATAVGAAVVALAGCSGADRSAQPGSTQQPSATNGAVAASSTPTPTGPTSSTVSVQTPGRQAPDTLPPGSKTFSTMVIATPSWVVTTLPRPVLTDDYVPPPANESVVLQVLSPEITIYDSATGYDVKTVLKNSSTPRSPLTFLADGQTSTRYKVLLPIRPNGSTGWIDPGNVKKFVHDYKIIVELSAFRLTVYKGKNIAVTEKIGVGTDELPTPNGRYYLKVLLKSTDPGGLYGPFAYGLSGFSEQLTSWNGGQGVIGIHGTNHPELLGRKVSHGCIRMSNGAITKLASFLPLGTPVIVLP